MSLRVRILLTIALFILIFLVDIVANKLYLYWTYNWLDQLMHVLGGMTAGFFILSAWETVKRQRASYFIVILGVLLIGIIWEIVEYKLHISRYASNFISDTTTDLIMDFLGALISYFIWIKIPQQNKQLK